MKISRGTFLHEFQSRIFIHLSCIRLLHIVWSYMKSLGNRDRKKYNNTNKKERDPELNSVPHGRSIKSLLLGLKSNPKNR